MSYDVTMFRIPDGTDALAAYQAVMEREENASAGDPPPTEDSVAQMQRIVAALKSWKPSLTESTSAPPLTWIELDDPLLGIRIIIQDQTVAVALPYFRDKTQQMMSLLAGCIETVRASESYSAFDPQLGRLVTAADVNEMTALYRGVDRVIPKVRAQASKPWWKLW